MRLITVLLGLSIYLGSVGAALAVDITIERISDGTTYICPRCQKAIRTGHIGEHAELMLADALKTSLNARHIPFTEGKENSPGLLLLTVYRFEERRGSNLAVDRPASVGFHVHLYKGSALVKTVVFDETQQPLSDNVLKLGTFLKRGGKWITADQLAQEGVQKVVDQLEKDLEGCR